MDRLTIGKVSLRTGCNIETIRYYEKEGLLPQPSRSAGGHRLYTIDQIERITFIRRCRELGFTMLEIRELLSLVDKQNITCKKVKQIAELHLVDIATKVADLERMQKTLVSLSKLCSGENVPDCPIIDALQSH